MFIIHWKRQAFFSLKIIKWNFFSAKLHKYAIFITANYNGLGGKFVNKFEHFFSNLICEYLIMMLTIEFDDFDM